MNPSLSRRRLIAAGLAVPLLALPRLLTRLGDLANLEPGDPAAAHPVVAARLRPVADRPGLPSRRHRPDPASAAARRTLGDGRARRRARVARRASADRVASEPCAGSKAIASWCQGCGRRVQLRHQGQPRAGQDLHRGVEAVQPPGECRRLPLPGDPPGQHHPFPDDGRGAGRHRHLQGTIRLSIGLEDPADLIDDLKRALKAAEKAGA